MPSTPSNVTDSKGNALLVEAAMQVAPDGSATAVLPAGTDRSSTIAVGGTAQELAPANLNRRALIVQNISAGDLWINETGGTAAADTAGSFKVIAGATFEVQTNRAISIVGATLAQAFTATEI